MQVLVSSIVWNSWLAEEVLDSEPVTLELGSLVYIWEFRKEKKKNYKAQSDAPGRLSLTKFWEDKSYWANIKTSNDKEEDFYNLIPVYSFCIS